MRRHLSSSVSVEESEAILEQLIKGNSNEEMDDLEQIEQERKTTRCDSVKVDKDFTLNIESSAQSKHLKRHVSVSVTKDLLMRRTCLILIVISLIFLVLFSLLIHKILTSVRDISVEAQVILSRDNM